MKKTKKRSKSVLTFLFVFLLSSFAISSPIFGENSCREVFTQSDGNSLCNLLVSEVKKGEDVSEIIGRVKSFVFDKVHMGQKRVLHNPDKCHKIQGVKIDLFCEDANRVKVDEDLTFGKATSSTISVKSCQHNEKENGKEIFAQVSVLIYWAPSENDPIILSADKKQLSPDETSEVQIKLKCGDCYLSGKKIALHSSASGEIFPQEVVTDKNGIATAVFKLKEPKSTEVTASYHGSESTLVFHPARLLWNLEVTVNHKGKTCAKRYLGCTFKQRQPIYYSQFTYQAKFENIPLNNYVAWASNYPIIHSPMKMIPIGKPIGAKSRVHAKTKSFDFDHPCENWRWKERSFSGAAKGIVSFGLPLGKIKKPASFIISFIMGGVLETDKKKIIYTMDPPGPYIRQKNLSDYFGQFTMPVYIPFKKIKSLQPFLINYTFSMGDCQKKTPGTATNVVGTWNFTFKFYPVRLRKT